MRFSHAARSRAWSVFWRMIKSASFPAILFLHEAGSAQRPLLPIRSMAEILGAERIFSGPFPGFGRPFEEVAE